MYVLCIRISITLGVRRGFEEVVRLTRWKDEVTLDTLQL